MTTGYIEMDTPEAFDLWHEDVCAILGYPNEETKTERYTHLFRGVDGKLYAKIDDDCPPQVLDGFEILPVEDVDLAEVVI